MIVLGDRFVFCAKFCMEIGAVVVSSLIVVVVLIVWSDVDTLFCA